MAIDYVPFGIVTGFWAIIGIVIPIFLPKRPNKALIQLSLVLTAACCWLFWLCTYMSQMNPLIGPKLNKEFVLAVAREWGHPIPDLDSDNGTHAEGH